LDVCVIHTQFFVSTLYVVYSIYIIYTYVYPQGILLRWNDLWHATAGLGWVTDNDVDAEEHLAPPTTALLDSLTDGTDRDSDGAPSRVTRCAAASGTVVAVTGGAKVLEQGGGKHSDPLLVAAANVADKMKEDVRAWQLKAEGVWVGQCLCVCCGCGYGCGCGCGCGCVCGYVRNVGDVAGKMKEGVRAWQFKAGGKKSGGWNCGC